MPKKIPTPEDFKVGILGFAQHLDFGFEIFISYYASSTTISSTL
jgi:hypothetical protein